MHVKKKEAALSERELKIMIKFSILNMLKYFIRMNLNIYNILLI